MGGLARDLPEGWLDELSKFLDEVEVNFDETEQLLTRNPIFLERTQDVGVISAADAIDFGLSGPNLRGSGVEHDVRRATPYMIYDRFDFDVPIGTKGDCYDRDAIRILEMRESVKLLRQCIKDIPKARSMWTTARSSCRPRKK